MKRVCLLSGMIVLGIAANVNAMKQERPATYQMIDSLFSGVRDIERIDWPTIFAVFDSMQGVIDVNEYRAENGHTLLTMAVGGKKLLVAKTLLEKYNANPNLVSMYDGDIPLSPLMTPLMYACYNDDLPMVKLLLHYGADLNLEDVRGHDCFYYARFAENPAILEVLNPYKKIDECSIQ